MNAPSKPSPSEISGPCKLCASRRLKLWRESTRPKAMTSADFAITDNRYGLTFSLHRCLDCGFLQTFEGNDAEDFYRNLVDTAYAEGYRYRRLQVEFLFHLIQKDIPAGGKLLDIGAANGMLVEYAEQKGYAVEGIEPSEWLCQEAHLRGISLYCGTFPDSRCVGPYDLITAIDVLEHVPDPLAMLQSIRDSLSPSGRAILVTPDVSAWMARLLGRRWWHFRLAHLSYFNQATLRFALQKSGLQPVRFCRPAWVFSVRYLWERLAGYWPALKRVKLPKRCETWVLPIQFRDSWLVVVERISHAH